MSPEGGWTRRVGNRATVACNATGEVWHVVCDGSRWVGSIGNCSLVAEDLKDEKKGDSPGPLPYGEWKEFVKVFLLATKASDS